MNLAIALLIAPVLPFVVAVMLPRGWLTLCIIPIAMLGAFLIATQSIPAPGSTDAAGYGMSMGFYWLMVYAGLMGAGIGWLAQLARQVIPALAGWRYALAAAALFLAGFGFAASFIL